MPPLNITPYSSHKYDVNVISIFDRMKKKVNETNPWGLEISKEEFISRLQLGVNSILGVIMKGGGHFDNRDLRAPCLNFNNPAFSSWFAKLIMVSTKFETKLILDYHINKCSDRIYFINTIEYYVLDQIQSFRKMKLDDTIFQLTEWVREQREKHADNLVQKSDFKKNLEFDHSVIFSKTFGHRFYDLLIDYVEEDSKQDFKELLIMNKAKRRILFSPGFKKIMLIAPLRSLIIRNKFNKNKNDTADWILLNFGIKSAGTFDSFSKSNILKEFSKEEKEPKNGKIQFLHWF